ncbi:MAG: sulfotransferase [Myxococcota bacterium]|nr:sulfotransferase [Myxococcota bacterium]
MSQPADFFPDFFIVGAPRCGTTALSKALRRNPRVLFSRPKETHYFTLLRAMEPSADVRSAYVERFYRRFRPELHQAAGEGSTNYLYSAEALKTILSLNPEAKFIAMVRNPVEMVPSLHQLMLLVLKEEVEDFATAWELRHERAQGRSLPRYVVDPRMYQYEEIGRLGTYVDQLFRIAGRERTRVFVYDDFTADPLAMYKEALAFIGVDYDGRVEFPRTMNTRHYRSRRVHDWVARVPRSPGDLPAHQARRSRETGASGRVFRKRALELVASLNLAPGPKRPLSPEMRRVLQETFADEIALLGGLLGRDLSHWR